MNPIFFRAPSDLQKWFDANHSIAPELWVGYFKKGSGEPSVTWQESVDEALCVGWIDGIRKSMDEKRYAIRFTPRKPSSIWSSINIRRARKLTRAKRMRPAGLKAFAGRVDNKVGVYSYEQRPPALVEPYRRIFRKNKKAWAFFEAQPPGYQKVVTWWIVSARRDQTRLKRLKELIEESAGGRRIRQFTRVQAPKK